MVYCYNLHDDLDTTNVEQLHSSQLGRKCPFTGRMLIHYMYSIHVCSYTYNKVE